MPVRIVTDSSCDLSADVASELGVEIVPLSIRFGDTEYLDRDELSVQDFYSKMASSEELPATAAPSPGQFQEKFQKLAAEGADGIVCINISRELSATMEAALAAQKLVKDEIDVRVINSKSITGGVGTMVLHAARAAEAGKSIDEIVALVEELIPRTHVWGALDTLDNLKKGGRIGGAQAFLGSMLSIKPIIDISTGVVEELAKQRTRKKEMVWLCDQLAERAPLEDLALLHANASDYDDFLDMFRAALPDQEFRTGWIGAVIGTHGGPGILGATWLD